MLKSNSTINMDRAAYIMERAAYIRRRQLVQANPVFIINDAHTQSRTIVPYHPRQSSSVSPVTILPIAEQ